MAFKIRTSAPSTTNKYWKHTSAGGYNSCIHIANGSVLPNCVGYAWGRFYEILGSKPKLSRRNAEDWFGYTADGYKRGKTPKVGAVICWRKGKAGVNSDGAGHVAIVERVNSDGSILISESGYNSFRFRTRTLAKPYSIGSAYTFQGFIYNPAVDDKVVEEDGLWGQSVTRYTQIVLGCPAVDGFISNQLFSCKKYLPNMLAVSWEFQNIARGGSATIKALQKLVGEEQDGFMGINTVKALQRFLKKLGLYNGAIDGIAGKLTVIAWQKYLNMKLA